MQRRARTTRRRESPRAAQAVRVSTPRQGYMLWCLAVLLLALVLRTLYVSELGASPLASLKIGDAVSYDTWAHQIAAGEWVGSEVFYQAPLYPYFLAVHYAVFGQSLFAVRLTQGFLGALACLFLMLAGTRWFSRRVGILAGLFLALYAPAIFFTGLIQKTTLAVALLCLLLWLMSRLSSKPTGVVSLGCGLVLGALVLTRENALLLAIPVLGWAVWRFPERRLQVAVWFLAGMTLALGPALARNYVVGRELHLTTSQMGPNLYIGNNPSATGTYRPLRPGREDARYEKTDAREVAEEALGRALTPAEVSRFYTLRVIEYVRTQPGDWVKLMGRKTALLWNATEVGDTEDLYAYATQSALLQLLLPLHFGVFAPIAFLGGIVTWRERGRLWPLYAVLATYAASVVAFYVFARYRFPMVPIVLLFAAAALVDGPSWLRERRPRAWILALGSGALVAVACNWPLLDRERMEATSHFNFGHVLALEGRNEAAIDQFHAALRLDPSFAQARNDLGFVLAKLGRVDEAASELERALGAEPDFFDALTNLGEIRLRQERFDEAEQCFQRALELDSESVVAHGGLARSFFRKGDHESAARHFERSLELAPDNASAHNNLGVLAAIRNDFEAAIAHFQSAIAIDPTYDEAKNNLKRAIEASSGMQKK